jgi:hypothetical protein
MKYNYSLVHLNEFSGAYLKYISTSADKFTLETIRLAARVINNRSR